MGSVKLLVSEADGVAGVSVVLVQRHGADPDREYTQPHRINVKAVFHALEKLGVTRVVAFGSVGTLKPKAIPIGTVVMPDDWFAPWSIESAFEDGRAHVVPKFGEKLRTEVLEVLRAGAVEVLDKGTYVQTTGPRFETKAEIKFLMDYADVVGMTAAKEADFANEAGIEYALVCMVDNLANGLNAEKAFEFQDFKNGLMNNQKKVDHCLELILNYFSVVQTQEAIEEKENCKIEVDLIASARYIVPIIPEVVLDHHSLVIKNGKVVEIMPTLDVFAKYSAKEIFESEDSVLMPGLINMHTHLGMTYLRGYADDTPLAEWLSESIWPAEAKFVSPEFVRDGVALGIAEMISSGTTCCNDMYWFPDHTYAVAEKAGFRMCVGLTVIDFPTNYGSNFDDYLSKARGSYAKLVGNPLYKFSIAPHAPYTVHDENLIKSRDFSNEFQLPIHVHLHETAPETDDSEAGTLSMSKHRSDFNCRPFENFDRLGLLNSKLIAVHMTQLNDKEIARAGAAKINIVHCPSSNLKLASGLCPLAKLERAGVNVCIGTDSTASNNTLDVWSEMRTAALLAKVVDSNASSIGAYSALKMATINGAEALGWEKEIGSLEPGKSADFIAVQLNDIHYLPLFDVMSHLVYIADRNSVTDAWVNGKRLLANRQLQTLNKAEVIKTSSLWGERLREFRSSKK